MDTIYLDHASAMPIDSRVFDFAKKYLTDYFGNPSSLYNIGQDAKEAVDESRKKIAELINAETDKTIIFTASATESNNLAIRGTAYRNIKDGKEVLASAIEHISVINPMKDLQKNGWIFNTVLVDKYGVVDLEQLKKMINKNTIVTSIMYANNEIGTIQPISEIAKIVHEKGHFLHVDATAAAGRIPIDVQKDGIDLLTLSSNDLYGPRGAGALYVKPGVKIQSVMPGGGQERGLRSGTENVFAIAGMGEAARIAKKEMKDESNRLIKIRDKLIQEITKIDDSYLTGHPKNRLPNHASFRFSYIEGESILLNMDIHGIQVATGSACSSKTLEPSHVLIAIGLKHEEAHGSMVMTLGQSNNIDQVPKIVKLAKETVERLRKLSPLTK
ncbi:MAG: cysteine desulfurase NifS [Thermoplasmata archaeon M9B1D]|nr:MAG: cysteine desulfurase NifS [Thermoplasmata archaeon M9B1D]PNX51087.1 MAG: cysteine desulfurase NifS [Thermoplasmata archaeon M8B2D]